MKIIFLTSCKTHHKFLISKISKTEDVYVFKENDTISPKFKTHSKIEKLTESFENKYMSTENFKKSIISQETFDSINSDKVLTKLKVLNPNLIFVLGTKKISSNIIEEFNGSLINLHGGDAERYRGLDSHLWAIYHKDFDALKVTAHFVSKELDEGEIVKKEKLDLSNISSIAQLRYQNILTCEKILSEIINEYKFNGVFKSKKQNDNYSRYYSFMPKDLKPICIKKFNKFIRLQNG